MEDLAWESDTFDPWEHTEQLLTTSIEPWNLLVGGERAVFRQLSRREQSSQGCGIENANIRSASIRA
jgi:hypothetical protein